ncbi:hypothetical protein GQF42_20160 [Streptomyces broussonetiae]|uniref:Uncharacterized protein n=1 Tax=Streptomyces broussonetiae TaxID=2686304 RepID=A0A6I6MX33_9ACTN|nr:hypothetical protein [Streptomyces broussonetiae]QHA05298.1 hypothetical protein GQF42_20160 [Streptomyces broussonetiae]
MRPRTFAVVGAGVGATALVAAGIAYASTVGSAQPAKPAHRAAQPVHRAAQPARRPAPATAPLGSRGEGGERGEGRDGGGRGRGHGDGGRIYFNERTYSPFAEGCITTTGSSSFSVVNDSRRTIEVFRGFNCDDGSPVTTVGPHADTYGTVTRTEHAGVFGSGSGLGFGFGFGDDGVVGSFRVVRDHDEW